MAAAITRSRYHPGVTAPRSHARAGTSRSASSGAASTLARWRDILPAAAPTRWQLVVVKIRPARGASCSLRGQEPVTAAWRVAHVPTCWQCAAVLARRPYPRPDQSVRRRRRDLAVPLHWGFPAPGGRAVAAGLTVTIVRWPCVPLVIVWAPALTGVADGSDSPARHYRGRVGLGALVTGPGPSRGDLPAHRARLRPAPSAIGVI